MFFNRSQRIEYQYFDPDVKSPVHNRARSPESRSSLKLAHCGSISCLGRDDAGQLMASGGVEGRLKIWNLVTREMVASLAGHHGPVSGAFLLFWLRSWYSIYRLQRGERLSLGSNENIYVC